MTNEPLFLDTVLHEKIWGGSHLKAFGYRLPSDKVGECWAISGHPHGVSTVKNGEFAGWKLDKLYQDHRELFAESESPVFPLLTKILDANDWLSVQVHPDDDYARIHEGELGKTECWYIISAEPGAEIIYGHKAKTREELSVLIKAGAWDTLLRKVPVKAGDFFYVPSGTMHAIGKGIVVLETQQSSDTTYRVYDFDRRDAAGNLRALHIQQSIDTLTLPGDRLPENKVETKGAVTRLLHSPFFEVYKWEIAGTLLSADAFFAINNKWYTYVLVSIIEGSGELVTVDRSYPIQKGDHFILPSALIDWKIIGQSLTVISSRPVEAKNDIMSL